MKYMSVYCFLVLCLPFNLEAQDLSSTKRCYEADDISCAISSIEKFAYGTAKYSPEVWILFYSIFKKAETTKPYSQFPDDCLNRQHEAFSALLQIPGGKKAIEGKFGAEWKYYFNKFYSEFVTYAGRSMKDENFRAAVKNYKRALKVYDDIHYLGMETSTIDTVLVFNTAYSAIQAKEYNEAEKYFKQLADANVQMKGYAIVYRWLAKYYIVEKKDMAAALAMVQKGIQYFPGDKELTELMANLKQENK